MKTTQELNVGQRIKHVEFGDGVVIEPLNEGFIRAFFAVGERQVPLESLRFSASRDERILQDISSGTPERLTRLNLVFESYALPLIENATSMTAAKIDLLPHQVVLTHRIATSSPRRFLIADEVGLGKTIETALILRELASRGELQRAIMIVPAGLVNNWHRELNEVFNLDFEVFGSEGDVTDRKSNAFAKHDRLIASIDTLKRPARIKRLLNAPPWDLIVFDEAHHLTAHLNGNKVRKTQNYKLAEALREHTTDLLLLSATPHQGDHFAFYMVIRLLNQALFKNPEDMVDNRYRLNNLVFRRTKADACRPDGKPLFTRRWVHTESFTMKDSEREFYLKLREYLEDGFALAKRQGQKGQALGFVMAIFQKIAASSFAAVNRTLRRRLLSLTIHESLLREKELDIERKLSLTLEAKELIKEEFGISDDPIGRSEVERILADLKFKLVKKLDQEELALLANSDDSNERISEQAEDVSLVAVTIALPEERLRIKELLESFPCDRETKIEKLLSALNILWQQNPREKVVIFATYLGTVDLIAREIKEQFPEQEVVILRGGDHGAKLAAERRFKQKDSVKVLICTAAGREGINLQVSRILFNFDLPWNPMNIEQRIGRIHRYGQEFTAQVYNLVLSDTIEGKIFLLLNDKLLHIAKAVGKIDENGNIAEDLRTQILGQLSERLSYERLYQEALSDPELKRTSLELESALENASEARKVMFELFQDLEEFSLEDYKPFADNSASMQRLLTFLKKSAEIDQRKVIQTGDDLYELLDSSGNTLMNFTTDRDALGEDEKLDLLGLDHPYTQEYINKWQSSPAEDLSIVVKSKKYPEGIITWWFVQFHENQKSIKSTLLPVAVDNQGERSLILENLSQKIYQFDLGYSVLTEESRMALLQNSIKPILDRELKQETLTNKNITGYSSSLISWVEIVN